MRLALVTGGHRRLGAAISGALAQAGYTVALHGRGDVEAAPDLVALLDRAGHGWADFAADLSDAAAVEALIPQVTAHFGRAPDLLVNSAALFGQDRLDTVSADDLATHFAVNTTAPTLLTRSFAAAGGEGDRSIVNILDQRIDQPHGDQLAYTLSKMALAGLTQLSARTLAPGIRVNAVAPGLTLATDEYSAAQVARLGEAMPLSRLSSTQEVAAAVLYLAAAPSVTGQVLYVDGGAHLRSFDRDFMHLERD